jgi:hypothetical protein
MKELSRIPTGNQTDRLIIDPQLNKQ